MKWKEKLLEKISREIEEILPYVLEEKPKMKAEVSESKSRKIIVGDFNWQGGCENGKLTVGFKEYAVSYHQVLEMDADRIDGLIEVLQAIKAELP